MKNYVSMPIDTRVVNEKVFSASLCIHRINNTSKIRIIYTNLLTQMKVTKIISTILLRRLKLNIQKKSKKKKDLTLNSKQGLIDHQTK